MISKTKLDDWLRDYYNKYSHLHDEERMDEKVIDESDLITLSSFLAGKINSDHEGIHDGDPLEVQISELKGELSKVNPQLSVTFMKIINMLVKLFMRRQDVFI